MKRFHFLSLVCIILMFLCGSICADPALIPTPKPTITFGTLYFYPPFVYSNNVGPYGGFDVEFARAICSKLNANCRFVSMPMKLLFDGLNHNNIDAAISALSITRKRQKTYSFTVPYMKGSASYLLLAQNKPSGQELDLKGKTIGAVEDSSFYRYANKLYNGVSTINTYEDVDSLIDALAKKEIDVALLDTPVANYWVNNSRNNFIIFGEPLNNPLLLGDSYGIMVNKANTTLLNQINNAIAELQTEGIDKNLEDKYFATGVVAK